MEKIEIKINKQRIVKELIELIKVYSPSKGEGEISKVLQRKFSALGLDVIEDSSMDKTNHGSNNLICNLKGDCEITPVLFTAHMDTVSVDDQITPLIKNNYLMSDGTTILGADNKVGIAIMLEAIKLLKEYDVKHGHIQFVLTVGEESGLIGAKAINQSLLNAAYGYALDHTGKIGHIVTKGIYHVNLLIKIKVPTYSASNTTAIKIATKAIKRIRLGEVDDETTIHIVNFSGQNERDLLYDYAKIKMEIKSFNKNKLNKEIELIRQTISSLAKEYAVFTNVETDLFCEGFNFSETDLVVKTAKNAANTINLECEKIETTFFSDANIFTSYGIPTVNLAVGYENIHTHLERYNLCYLNELTRFVISIIKEVAKSAE